MENRKRWCLVAVSKGLALPQEPAKNTCTGTVGDILEAVAEDDPSWSKMAGLKDKEIRDAEAGKSFKMQVIDAESTSIPTITKGYAKNRSTDPKVAHPSDKSLLRLLTVKEHARAKTIPDNLLPDDISKTTGHEALGQSIIHSCFVAVGNEIGKVLQAGFDLNVAEKKNTKSRG